MALAMAPSQTIARSDTHARIDSIAAAIIQTALSPYHAMHCIKLCEDKLITEVNTCKGRYSMGLAVAAMSMCRATAYCCNHIVTLHDPTT